jgi:hypothetical protein
VLCCAVSHAVQQMHLQKLQATWITAPIESTVQSEKACRHKKTYASGSAHQHGIADSCHRPANHANTTLHRFGHLCASHPAHAQPKCRHN